MFRFTPNKKMSKHHKVSSLLALILVLSVTAACQVSNQNPIIKETIPADGEIAGVTSSIGITFNKAVDAASLEKAFSISPEVDGAFAWDDNTVWFNPARPLTPNTAYQVRISGDVNTLENETIRLNLRWDFSVREPELLYYQLAGEWGEIWRATADGQNQRPLTETGGRVIDYATDPPGDLILYSVYNEMGGSDLWVMDRAGKDKRTLVNCYRDICREGTWSKDSAQIAYTREIANPEISGSSPSQIWMLNVNTGDTAQFNRADNPAIGYSPSFSPDGKILAYYDPEALGIRGIDLESSQAFFYPTTSPGSGGWSPDSSKIIFTDVVPAEHEPFVEVVVADLASQEVTPAFGDPIRDTEFSQPRWSPDGDWVALGLRPVNSSISKALWALQIGSERQRLIEDEPSATFSAYQWDPWGQRLVYQRLALGFSPSQISIWVWDWESGQSRQIIENGGRPIWLP
jgi:Tol biopolymer transport system component